MPTTATNERLSRALTAFLRQEVQAPATAITEFLDILIEDARRLRLDALLPDLDRMLSASVQLNTFVSSIIKDSSSDSPEGETPEAFHRRGEVALHVLLAGDVSRDRDARDLRRHALGAEIAGVEIGRAHV